MRRAIHNLFVGALLFLASLTFASTVIAGWTHQTALVTDRFVGVISDVTSDPQVVSSLSTRVADQVVTRLMLEQRLQNLLPDQLDRLAAPVSQAVNERLAAGIAKLLSSPQFQEHWTAALTRLHAGFLNIINGDSQFFTTTNGKLTLDLLAVTDAVITQLQADGILPTAADFPRFSEAADRTDFLARLSTYTQAQLPPDFGQIPIADASAVETIGNALHLFDVAIVGLAIVTLVLAVLGILLADRRMRALAGLGLTIEVILVILIVVLAVAQRSAGDVLATPDGHVVVAALIARLADSLTVWLALIAVVVLFITVPAAFLARRSSRTAAAVPAE